MNSSVNLSRRINPQPSTSRASLDDALPKPIRSRAGGAPRVAIVHDWLPLYGGAERVLEQMLHLFPDADLFSMIDSVPEDQRAFLQGKKVHTSLIQRLPFGRTRYRSYLFFMPYAVEQFDLSAYDIVLSSSYAVAKGVITGPDQLHICYCHSPMRYAWDLQHQYLAEAGLTSGLKSLLARIVLHYIRLWDVRTSSGVDHFIANSNFIARRIQKTYGRASTVIYPPVNTQEYSPQPQKHNHYLTVARFVPYKKVPLIVEAFSRMPDRQLRVVGDGPDWNKVAAKAGSNVKLLGRLSRDQMKSELAGARALVYAAEEDFGIVPVEAQACGTPVIAFGRGGVAETVLDGVTGVLFQTQSVEAICNAVHEFESWKFDPARIRAHSEQFSTERFRTQFGNFVAQAWAGFRAGAETVAPGH